MQNQLNYAKMLNSNLPTDIRITASAEVPDDFNARYHCIAREYRYFFVENLLDVEKMRDASKFFLGEHDFRNFCKINPSNALDYKLKKKFRSFYFDINVYRRTIFSIGIEDMSQKNEIFDPRMKMYSVLIKGSSFLWHQAHYKSYSPHDFF
jgi:tRNA pseudouridine38/39 synthase